MRADWLCLNGRWEFELDQGDSGLERGLRDRPLAGHITVPFCPESTLSGVGHVDFLQAVWYRRTVEIPAAWAGRRVQLHFQAIDYDATVWVNGVEVGRHRGGFTPLHCDLGGIAEPGDWAQIVVRAREPRGEPRPGGKQSNFHYANRACDYTRTTGIWQTVWLEPVPETHLRRPRLTPDLANRRLEVVQPVAGPRSGLRLRATLRDEAGEVDRCEVAADGDFTPRLRLEVPSGRLRPWSPADPHLYALALELLDGEGSVVDRATSYAGMRSVTVDGPAVLLNGQPVFQRLVLDQGYYPDGILTAPSDEALCQDILLSQAAGFNGARLHQKVFEERFLYHADRLGYLVWGEYGDWGLRGAAPRDPRRHQPAAALLTQWLEVLHRDQSHPCIIGWCPLNEQAEPIEDGITALDDLAHGLVLATRAADPSRPVLDASGWSHRVGSSDIYDAHDYDQDPESFRRRHTALAEGKPFVNGPADRPWSVPWRGQPYFISEFGGIWWNPEARADEPSWGYGDRPRSEAEFRARFEGLCAAQLDNPHLFGYCYTQLTDVFQEQNGLYFFDRRPKFDLDWLRSVQARPAAIERPGPGDGARPAGD